MSGKLGQVLRLTTAIGRQWQRDTTPVIVTAEITLAGAAGADATSGAPGIVAPRNACQRRTVVRSAGATIARRVTMDKSCWGRTADKLAVRPEAKSADVLSVAAKFEEWAHRSR